MNTKMCICISKVEEENFVPFVVDIKPELSYPYFYYQKMNTTTIAVSKFKNWDQVIVQEQREKSEKERERERERVRESVGECVYVLETV